MQAPKLLTVREVARRLNIGTRTVWRWTASGELPAPVRMGKKGRVVRWPAAEIEKYLERVAPRPRPNGCHPSGPPLNAFRRP